MIPFPPDDVWWAFHLLRGIAPAVNDEVQAGAPEQAEPFFTASTRALKVESSAWGVLKARSLLWLWNGGGSTRRYGSGARHLLRSALDTQRLAYRGWLITAPSWRRVRRGIDCVSLNTALAWDNPRFSGCLILPQSPLPWVGWLPPQKVPPWQVGGSCFPYPVTIRKERVSQGVLDDWSSSDKGTLYTPQLSKRIKLVVSLRVCVYELDFSDRDFAIKPESML